MLNDRCVPVNQVSRRLRG